MLPRLPKVAFIIILVGNVYVMCKSGSSLTYKLLIDSDPTYIIAPVLQSRSGREDLKKLFVGSISFPYMLFIIVPQVLPLQGHINVYISCK